MPVQYKADLNGWLGSDRSLAEWTRRMWKTAKVWIYANIVDGKYYVTCYGIMSGPFGNYLEAFNEWSTALPRTQERDPYMDWREAHPRHAYALENHHHDWCLKAVDDKKGEFTEEEMDRLWQTATMFESGEDLTGVPVEESSCG